MCYCFHSFKELSVVENRPFLIEPEGFISIGDAKVGGFAIPSKCLRYFPKKYFVLFRHSFFGSFYNTLNINYL
jgi:hypothetical protein